jgi:hypothetical protein
MSPVHYAHSCNTFHYMFNLYEIEYNLDVTIDTLISKLSCNDYTFIDDNITYLHNFNHFFITSFNVFNNIFIDPFM